MAPIDPIGKEGLKTANGNGAGRLSAPGGAPGTSLTPAPAAETARGPETGTGREDPRDAAKGPLGGSSRAAAEPEARGREEFPPDQPPGPAELMPRRRGRGSKQGAAEPRGRRGAKGPVQVSRPMGARGAARDERQEGAEWLVRQAGRARTLPARREGAEARRGGYVMGTANLCRSCGLAVWLAGKDAHGRWVKVNLDGSPHICGLPMTGLGRIPMPLALPPGPQALPPPAAPQAAAPYLWPSPQAVTDQGRIWVERFMVGVALVALLFLATIPRDMRNSLSGPRGSALRSAVQQAAVTPVAAAAARPDPPKKDTFSLGSTEDDVMAVMGPPREITDNRWWYGSSYVDFRNNRVVNFSNSIHGELKVKMQGIARTFRPTSLGKGLTKDEVLNLQGTPTRLAGNRWYYGSSYVDFREERVADYFNGVLRELKIPARSPSQ